MPKKKVAYKVRIQRGTIYLAPKKENTIIKTVPYENPTDTFKKPAESFIGTQRGGSADSCWPMQGNYRLVGDPRW